MATDAVDSRLWTAKAGAPQLKWQGRLYVAHAADGVKMEAEMETSVPEIDSLKQRLRSTWTAGDFGKIANHLTSAGEEFIDRLDVQPGTRLLDVACGTGNVALPAARIGAVVTACDIAPNLLEQARERAESAGLEIQFDEGDAEQLPYPDGSFDIVVTMFGAMFAPRPEVTAGELLRVCRSGGRVAMANWTPEGFAGQMFRTIGKHVPPPPMPPPTQWGVEEIVRDRLREGVTELVLSRQFCHMKYPFPPADVVELFRTYFGPTQRAFESLEGTGQDALRRDLEALWTEHNRATDGTTHVHGEYLQVIATKG
jgi:SAM-dependent methyltransferase